LRIFHLADTHFGPTRLEQKVAAFEKCLAKIESVMRHDSSLSTTKSLSVWNMAIIAGDIFDHSLHVEDPGAQEAVRLIGELNRRMPVLLIKGNHSHDRQSVRVFDYLRTQHALITSDSPEVVELKKDGTLVKVSIESIIQNPGDDDAVHATLITLPYPSYSFIAATESLPAEGLRAAVSNRIGEVIKLFRLIERKHKILVYHGTVSGARFCEAHRMTGMDIELSPWDIKDSGFQFVAGGHIHFAQVMEEAPVFYPGGLAYTTYGDEGQRGMWIHELKDIYWDHNFFDVHAPMMKTWKLDLREGHHILLPPWHTDPIVEDLKVQLIFRETQNIDLPAQKERLGKWFPNVKTMMIDKIVERVEGERAREAKIQEVHTLREKVQAWLEYSDIRDYPPSLLDKADLVEAHDSKELIEMEQL